jgi:hypothetical protein
LLRRWSSRLCGRWWRCVASPRLYWPCWREVERISRILIYLFGARNVLVTLVWRLGISMTTSIFSILIICFSFILNIAVSNGYLYSRICRPSTILVRSVFVATFGLSASLLELCLWEINGSLQNEFSHPMKTARDWCFRARGIAWKLVVRVLLADLILVIPFLLSFTVFSGYIPGGNTPLSD